MTTRPTPGTSSSDHEPDHLLAALAQLDPQRGFEPDGDQRERSRDRLQRLTAAPAGERAVITAGVDGTLQARRKGLMRRGLGLGLAAAAAAVVVTGAAAVLPQTTNIAYASWTPTPEVADAAAGLAQAEACASQWQQRPAGGVLLADVLIAEQRGSYSVTVVRKDDGAVLCQAIDTDTPTGWEAMAPTRVMGADEVSVESRLTLGGLRPRSSIVGQVGAGVTGIDVVVGSRTITASLGGGRWVAWWPGDQGGEVGAVQVVIHTADGDRTQPSEDLYL